MDLVTALRLMARRWMVVVPVLILTAVAVVFGASQVEPAFQARGSVLVLPLASESAGPTGLNPYNDYGGQRLAVSHLVSLADSASFGRQVVGADGSGTFELTPQADVGLIDLVVTGPSNVETIATMEKLIGLLEGALENLQLEINAPQHTWVEMRRLDTAEEAEQLAGSRNRVIVAISAVGLLAAVGAAFAAEGLIGRRADDGADGGRRGRRAKRSKVRGADRTEEAAGARPGTVGTGSFDGPYGPPLVAPGSADPESVSR